MVYKSNFERKYMDKHANQLLKNSFEFLNIAKQELFRPLEAAVTLCVCQSTRNAATGFLSSFLLSKSILNIEDKSLSELLNQCAEIDPQFNSIDLSCFECRTVKSNKCEDKYCLSMAKVKACYEKTQAISELVSAKFKTNNKSFS